MSAISLPAQAAIQLRGLFALRFGLLLSVAFFANAQPGMPVHGRIDCDIAVLTDSPSSICLSGSTLPRQRPRISASPQDASPQIRV